MSTKYIWLVVGILGAAVLGAFWYTSTLTPSVLEPQSAQGTQPPTFVPQSSVSLSSGTIIIPPPAATSTGSAFTLTDQGGAAVPVADFIHNGLTIPDTANAGRYLLAGSLGYCADPAKCQAATSTSYQIYYNSAAQSFTIALTDEPIGEARIAMEQFLLTTLGITQQQLCRLNYYVGVTRYVNEQYTGKNLGFSFCSGATPLPQ